MKSILRFLTLAAAATLAVLASQEPAFAAGSAAAGTVNTIQPLVGSVSVFFFNTTGAHTGAPSCGASGQRWAIDPTTAAGQAMISVVMSAYALGKQITITGTGYCSVWPDTETVYYLTTVN